MDLAIALVLQIIRKIIYLKGAFGKMSTVDLILLGLVYDQPQSAYDMQKDIEYRNLSKWVKISAPSVYKKVLKLEAKGYLSSTLKKEGKMAEKAVYSITASGRDYFMTLMEAIGSSPIQILFDFNAVIANLNKMHKDDALVIIEKMESNINSNIEYLRIMAPQREHIPLVGRTIIEQQMGVLDSLREWIISFKEAYKEE